MGFNLIERIQAKMELFRLEQRYTRRRHRRSTFVSNAVYVDGEYIYNTPNTTGSSSNSHSGNSITYDHTPASATAAAAAVAAQQQAQAAAAAADAAEMQMQLQRAHESAAAAEHKAIFNTAGNGSSSSSKRSKRWSTMAMPGFGSSAKSAEDSSDWRTGR